MGGGCKGPWAWICRGRQRAAKRRAISGKGRAISGFQWLQGSHFCTTTSTLSSLVRNTEAALLHRAACHTAWPLWFPLVTHTLCFSQALQLPFPCHCHSVPLTGLPQLKAATLLWSEWQRPGTRLGYLSYANKSPLRYCKVFKLSFELRVACKWQTHEGDFFWCCCGWSLNWEVIEKSTAHINCGDYAVQWLTGSPGGGGGV